MILLWHIEPKPGIFNESLEIKDVLVGDVWILAGQSNMQGIGIIKTPLET